MNDLKGKYGEWGLVAGAAEGLGEAFSKALAERGMNLVLVDRQEALLESLAHRLESAFGVEVKKVHMDLASDHSVGLLMELISVTSCRLLIYNAAFSRVKKFLENDPADLERYIEVNTRTPIRLLHAFCTHHVARPHQKKGIILLSSLAGSWGTRLLAPYGATKAFTHILAESLACELKGEGYDLLASITGATSTPGYLSSLPRGKVKSLSVMHPETVVKACLQALGKRPYVIPGSRNKLIYFFMTRLLSRNTSIRIINRSVGRLYGDRIET